MFTCTDVGPFPPVQMPTDRVTHANIDKNRNFWC